jgi:hypothetical protein
LLGKYIYTICFSVGILLTAGLQAPYIVNLNSILRFPREGESQLQTE